jgi:hypothetical protein
MQRPQHILLIKNSLYRLIGVMCRYENSNFHIAFGGCAKAWAAPSASHPLKGT